MNSRYKESRRGTEKVCYIESSLYQEFFSHYCSGRGMKIGSQNQELAIYRGVVISRAQCIYIMYHFSFSKSCDSTKTATYCEWLIGGIRMSGARAYHKDL